MILENISTMILSFAVLSIPIVAVIGGVVTWIVKLICRQRLDELARRERIAAIERGFDPAQLPAARSL
jgi:hypothetical protein